MSDWLAGCLSLTDWLVWLVLTLLLRSAVVGHRRRCFLLLPLSLPLLFTQVHHIAGQQIVTPLFLHNHHHHHHHHFASHFISSSSSSFLLLALLFLWHRFTLSRLLHRCFDSTSPRTHLLPTGTLFTLLSAARSASQCPRTNPA